MFCKLKSKNNSYINAHTLDELSKSQLLDYIYFYQKNYKKINKKINLTKYKPHKLWTLWNKNYFTAISNNRFLDLTSFGTIANKSYKINNRGKNFKFFNFLINIQRTGEYFYNSPMFENSKIILDIIKKTKLKNYLIIGAGNAFEVVQLIKKYPNINICIIDLPEIISSGYLTIKHYFKNIRINLPNTAKKFSKSNYQINFYLPHQLSLIDGKFDLSHNIGSFQEMSLKTVNNYLGFIKRKLNKGALFISINNKHSRYVKNNIVKNYNFKNFEILNNSTYKKNIISILQK